MSFANEVNPKKYRRKAVSKIQKIRGYQILNMKKRNRIIFAKEGEVY
jgi:hypothetical protein